MMIKWKLFSQLPSSQLSLLIILFSVLTVSIPPTLRRKTTKLSNDLNKLSFSGGAFERQSDKEASLHLLRLTIFTRMHVTDTWWWKPRQRRHKVDSNERFALKHSQWWMDDINLNVQLKLVSEIVRNGSCGFVTSLIFSDGPIHFTRLMTEHALQRFAMTTWRSIESFQPIPINLSKRRWRVFTAHSAEHSLINRDIQSWFE